MRLRKVRVASRSRRGAAEFVKEVEFIFVPGCGDVASFLQLVENHVGRHQSRGKAEFLLELLRISYAS